MGEVAGVKLRGKLPEERTEFTVNIQKGSGSFEIVESGDTVASGTIKKFNRLATSATTLRHLGSDLKDTNFPLKTADVYKDFKLRGYQFQGRFQGIVGVEFDGSVGLIKWENNFITFLDSLNQTILLNKSFRQLLVPVGIEKVIINTDLHWEILAGRNENNSVITTYYDKNLSIARSGGLEIKNVTFAQPFQKPPTIQVTLQKVEFLPFESSQEHSMYEAIVAICEIIKKNVDQGTIKSLEIIDSPANLSETLITPILKELFEYIPLIKLEMSIEAEQSDHDIIKAKLSDENIQIKNMKLPSTEHCNLVIASNAVRRENFFQLCIDSVAKNGFLLLQENTIETENIKISGNVDLCLNYKWKNNTILLYRKKLKFDENILAIRIKNHSYEWINVLKYSLKNVLEDRKNRVILYAENEDTSGIVGLVNSLFKEYGVKNIRCYWICDKTAPLFSIHEPLYRAQISKDLLVNIYKNGVWGSFSDFPLDKNQKIESTHASVQLEVPGDLSSLQLVEGPLDPFHFEPTSQNTLIHIYYSELNFRDIMLASRKLSATSFTTDDRTQSNLFGLGFSGKTTSGKRYMGVTNGGAFSTLINQDSQLLIPIPDSWTLEEAATIPVAYATVLYSFFYPERLHRGDSILIHSGSGGVGQAAINICLYYGCTVFTTVGTEEKRNFIQNMFPSIPESHIGNSRDTSFEEMVMKYTNGKGVDVVLNSLSEEKLLASVRCLAPRGRFIEIGLFDFSVNNPLHMRYFMKEISFHAIELGHIFKASTAVKIHIVNLINEHINNNAIKPLVRTVFDLKDVESAFRYMASGKHIGKILLKILPEEPDIHASPKPISLPLQAKYHCHPGKTYIVCGGLGGLGLELVTWLVSRGARNVIIVSRRKIRTGYQNWTINRCQLQGAKVIISTSDITTEAGVQNLLHIANELGPVAAIFNLAMVLKDAVFENQTEENFIECIKPKIDISTHLDKQCRKLCPQLEQFVIFSSTTSSFGNVGQTNYGLANSAIERICENRRTENLPATAIEWGPMADVGVLVESNIMEKIVTGMIEQPITSYLRELDFLLRQPNPVVRSMILSEKQSNVPDEKQIVDIISNIIGLKEIQCMDPETRLANCGLDSITAVELKYKLESELDIILSLKDVNEMTFGQLQNLQKK